MSKVWYDQQYTFIVMKVTGCCYIIMWGESWAREGKKSIGRERPV